MGSATQGSAGVPAASAERESRRAEVAVLARRLFAHRLVDVAALLGLAVLGALRGYVLCGDDIDTYLPFVLFEHDGTLFRNDLLLGTLSSHPVYIWKAFSILLRWVRLDTLMRAAFVVQTLTIATGTALIFAKLVRSGRAWMLFLLLLVIPITSGGNGVIGINPYGVFHAGALAFGVALLTYTLAARGRWIWGGALCGLMFLFHPITAVYAAGFYFVQSALGLCDRKRALPILLGGLLLTLLALPSLIPAFRTFLPSGGGKALDPSWWRALARFRMGQGYFLSAWAPGRLIQISACYAALLLWFRHRPGFRSFLPMIVTTAVGLIATAAAEVFDLRFLLRLQLGRCQYFVCFLTAAFAVDALLARGRDWPAPPARRRWSLLAAAVLAVIAIGAAQSQPTWAAAMVVASIIACLGLLAATFRGKLRPGRFYAMLAALVVAATVPRAANAFNWTTAQALRDPWVDVSAWLRTAVARDEVVMIPIYMQDFRPWSYRAQYCNWKDGAPHLFCDRTLPLWWERIQKFGVTMANRKKDLPTLYHRTAIAVARSEGLRYVVFDKKYARPPGPVIYENSGYQVVDLKE